MGDAKHKSSGANRGGEKLARFVSADGSPSKHRGDRLIRTNDRLSAKNRRLTRASTVDRTVRLVPQTRRDSRGDLSAFPAVAQAVRKSYALIESLEKRGKLKYHVAQR